MASMRVWGSFVMSLNSYLQDHNPESLRSQVCYYPCEERGNTHDGGAGWSRESALTPALSRGEREVGRWMGASRDGNAVMAEGPECPHPGPLPCEGEGSRTMEE